jgi:sugar/nucleoside kinase (ribokinase family)
VEIGCAWALDMLRQVDLVALNLEEAAGFAGVETADPETVVQAALAALLALNPHLKISITAGARGSWGWDSSDLHYVPAFPVPVVNPAGAGDAHLSGILAGLSWGLELIAAQEIGTLVAAQSVTSPHTIHPGICPAGLQAFASQIHAPISAPVARLLADLARENL